MKNVIQKIIVALILMTVVIWFSDGAKMFINTLELKATNTVSTKQLENDVNSFTNAELNRTFWDGVGAIPSVINVASFLICGFYCFGQVRKYLKEKSS